MIARGLSARRACELLRLSRSCFAYQRAPNRNVELTARLREMAAREPKLGYRMAWSRLRVEFAPLNVKRVQRIWSELGLGVRSKPRRRIKGARKPELWAGRPRQVWCIDFAHDACANGTKIKCLAVVDEASRECVAMEVSRRIPSDGVVQTLQTAFAEFGKPEHIRCDNGPEFTSWTMRLFLQGSGVGHALIQPGSPWQNGFAESFIGTFRSECLDTEIFQNLADAQLKIALWVKFYNEDRPHSSLNYIQPRAFREKWDEISSHKEEAVV
jgi:putative transposase